MAVAARRESASSVLGKLGEACSQFLLAYLRELLLGKARRIHNVSIHKRKELGTPGCMAPAADLLADGPGHQRKRRIKRIEQGGFPRSRRPRKYGNLPRKTPAQIIQSRAAFRRNTQDRISRRLIFRKEMLRVPPIEVHLVDAKHNLCSTGALGKHEETAYDERMRIGRCGGDCDDDLGQIRHTRPLQQIRALFDMLDYALFGRYTIQYNDVSRKNLRIAASFFDPAAQLAEDDCILRRDMENAVIDL